MTKQNNTPIFTLVHSQAPPPPPYCAAQLSFSFFDCSSGFSGWGWRPERHPVTERMPSKWWICKYVLLWRRGALSSGFGRASLIGGKKLMCHSSKEEFFLSVAHISLSAFKEQGSPKCRQKQPKTLLIYSASGKWAISKRWKMHPASNMQQGDYKDSNVLPEKPQKARVCSPHTEGALWWPGRELSLWRGAEDSNMQPSHRKRMLQFMPRKSELPLMNIIPSQCAAMQQLTRLCLCGARQVCSIVCTISAQGEAT